MGHLLLQLHRSKIEVLAPTMSNVTRILSQIEHGDPSAPKQSLPLTDAAERIDKMLGEMFPMGSLNSQLRSSIWRPARAVHEDAHINAC